MAGIRNSKTTRNFRLETVLVLLVLSGWSAFAVFYFYRRGYLLYYGDAEAHLNIARRMVDSRTPGYDQVGTVWLPLLHFLMLPFVGNDYLWRTGLAGAISSAACFVAAGIFLFSTVIRLWHNRPAAVSATALLALNPNVLYLQATAMTETVFLAALLGLLYFSVRFRQTQSWGSLLGGGVAALAGTLTRYEGWFLIPFATLFIGLAARKSRIAKALLFGAVASAGPLYWLAHNWWYFGDALAFYSGPYSHAAIQGTAGYPGKGDWWKAWLYLRTAAQECAGRPLAWMAVAGGVVALIRKAVWPVLLLALPGVFYVWSIHSAATPIFVPDLWPHSYYNTRYGLALFPLMAFAAAALATMAPKRADAVIATAVVLVGTGTWLIHPREDAWITWKESQVNSQARRAWNQQAADFLRYRYRRGSGIFTSFGDLTAVFRNMGISLKETLTVDNEPQWMAAVARPDLFLREEWAVAMGGDSVQTSIHRARRRGLHYVLETTIIVPGAPKIEIYRRDGTAGPINPDENSLH